MAGALPSLPLPLQPLGLAMLLRVVGLVGLAVVVRVVAEVRWGISGGLRLVEWVGNESAVSELH